MTPTVPAPPFAVECVCGTRARGHRQPKPQVLTCAGCGRPVFILPAAASVFGPGATASAPRWVPNVSNWLPPTAAAMLALAVVGLVIATIVRGHRPAESDVSEARATNLLTERLTAARNALDEGSYHVARDELTAANDLLTRFPRAVDSDRVRQLRRWRKQAALLADLSSESVGEIARNAAGKADKDWDAIFRERYAGKAIVLDSRVFRDAAGHYHVDYHLEAAGAVGEWEFDKLRLLDALPLQQPQRLVFGFRLRAVRRLARDRWTVVPEPDSGVLLTDPIVLAGLSVPADGELAEVMRRQAAWDPDG
jgi:hypothetical protein